MPETERERYNRLRRSGYGQDQAKSELGIRAQEVGRQPEPISGLTPATVAEVPGPAPRRGVERPEFRVEQIAVGGVTAKRVPTEQEKQAERETLRLKKETEQSVKRLVKQTDIQTNFMTTVGLFKNLVGQIKGQEEEAGGLGLLPGTKAVIGATFKQPGYARTAAVPGQQRETALTLNRILTGQNRVIRGVVAMIMETLPTQRDPDEMVASKVAQSLKNAFRIVKSFEKAGFTPEQRIQALNTAQRNKIDLTTMAGRFNLTPEEDALIESIIKDVLATPATKRRKLGREIQKQNLKTRSGVSFSYEEIK